MKRSLLCLLAISACITLLAQKDCRQEEYQHRLLSLYPLLPVQYGKVDSFVFKHPLHLPRPHIAVDTSFVQPVPEKIIIPVVVHIIWSNSAQNISDAQVLSQIEALNKDFSAGNTDRNKIPSYFSQLAADCGISFALAKADPNGQPSSGIVRIQTSTGVFNFDDRMKSTATGGDNAWDAGSYLNIWVCNLVGGISGYASAPGGPKDKDGVVISTPVFGKLNLTGPFNLGRTAVHEIGHWLNLRHIWGDASCGDDKVDDTPTQQGASRGCNSGEKFSCGTTAHGDMYMNFMDFSDDACMFMFTNGQKQRMRVLFEAGGPRNSLLFSKGLEGDGLPLQALVPAYSDFDLILYPNPAANTITVQLKDYASSIGKSIYICNQLGQIVQRITVTSKLQQVNVSGLNPGLYFIKIEGLSISGMKKFVKQ